MQNTTTEATHSPYASNATPTTNLFQDKARKNEEALAKMKEEYGNGAPSMASAMADMAYADPEAKSTLAQNLQENLGKTLAIVGLVAAAGAIGYWLGQSKKAALMASYTPHPQA